ncbi:MAG: nucleotidyl transferase AbiEii/AbiGii toxin family protein [Peptococcaceae bacterium]|nr:nucleotidyl transferase AbiEii/AbiGii toxin family protein [Peptococcaceae bacterium]
MRVIFLSSYDVIYLGKKAEELGFVRDTLEKVTRLADILEYLNTNPILKESLALKGGTAINLTIFNLPRLSVDIDMDYLINNSRTYIKACPIFSTRASALAYRASMLSASAKRRSPRRTISARSWMGSS